ncbi:MAG: methyltransferase domain-containing protein [Actinomycetota bacterium]|nr:methyltransferase domain-containing protein [Actinomycetota bacterium]
MKEFYEAAWDDLPPDALPWNWKWRWPLLRRELEPGIRMLDLGCGAGHFAGAASAAGADVVGIDIAERALQRARILAPNAAFRLLEANGTLPLEHNSIDLVWCSEVIEHVADVGLLLLEARRVLKPDGRLLLTTPAHGLLRRVLIAAVRFDQHFDPLGQHLRFFSSSSLRFALCNSAYADVCVTECGGLPLLRSTLVARARRAARQSPDNSPRVP